MTIRRPRRRRHRGTADHPSGRYPWWLLQRAHCPSDRDGARPTPAADHADHNDARPPADALSEPPALLTNDRGTEHTTMDEIDITVTPAERRAIARLFRAQQAQAAEVARHAAHALRALDARDDDPAPWGRTLLIAAFEALYEAESTRVRHMQEGLDAFDLDVDDVPAQSTGVDAPSPARPVS